MTGQGVEFQDIGEQIKCAGVLALLLIEAPDELSVTTISWNISNVKVSNIDSAPLLQGQVFLDIGRVASYADLRQVMEAWAAYLEAEIEEIHHLVDDRIHLIIEKLLSSNVWIRLVAILNPRGNQAPPPGFTSWQEFDSALAIRAEKQLRTEIS